MRTRALAGWAAATLALCLALSGCNDDSDDSGAPAPSTGTEVTLTQPDAPFEVTVARWGGGVKPAQREQLEAALSRPLEEWVGGGFTDPEYPTQDFSNGFDAWTPGAAKLAAADRDTTTNAAMGDSAVAVVADRQQFRVFVFAEDGKPGGATARVDLRLTAERDDGSLDRVLVRGDVYLTPEDGHWRIFGYDLTRTEAPA